MGPTDPPTTLLAIYLCAQVYRAVDKATGQTVALKHMHLDGGGQWPLHVQREVSALEAVHHPNIVSLLHIHEDVSRLSCAHLLAAAAAAACQQHNRPGAPPACLPAACLPAWPPHRALRRRSTPVFTPNQAAPTGSMPPPFPPSPRALASPWFSSTA